MKNRAKCKLCNSIIESFHRYDYVSCGCGEISVDGGSEYFHCAAKDFTNFLRIDDEGNEIIVTVKEESNQNDPTDPSINPTKEELIKILDNMVANTESLPQEAMMSNITQYDYCSLLILLSSIFKTKD